MKDARGGLIPFSGRCLPSPMLSQAHPAQVQPCFINLGRHAVMDAIAVVEWVSQAGILKRSPRSSIAQAMRAFFAAMATTARQ